MARRGRFGRLPRQAPNLTATIVAIAREMANMQDQNIINAWEKGGEYEGSKVTDSEVLAHFKDRRDSMDQNDPAWDYYNNLVENYEFAIEESKMTLKYANHAVNDAQMSAFYRKWANKLPQDSEAYRELMRSAAQFLDASRNKGRASAAAAKAAAYSSALQSNYDKNEKGYDTATLFIARAMVLNKGGLTEAEYQQVVNAVESGGGAPLAELLSSMELDQNKINEAIDRINNDPDPTWAALRGQWQEAMKGVPGYDPSTPLTYDSWITMGADKQRGLNNRVGIANTYDDKNGAANAKSAAGRFKRWLLENKDIDVVAEYNKWKADVEAAAADPNISDKALINLGEEAVAFLTLLKGKAESDWLKGSLEAEIAAWNGESGIDVASNKVTGGALSVAESATGATTAESNPNGDLATTAAAIAAAKSRMDMVASGEGVYVVNPNAGKAGQPDLVVAGNPGPLPADQILVWTNRDGQTVPVVVATNPMTVANATTVDPRTGRPTQEGKTTPGVDPLVGRVATLPDGRTVYGWYTNGTLQWYDHPTYDTNAYTMTVGSDGSATITPKNAAAGTVLNPTSVGLPTVTDPTLMDSGRFKDGAIAFAYGSFGSDGRKTGALDLATADANAVLSYYTTTYGTQQQPAVDGSGNPILDAKGQPVMEPVVTAKMRDFGAAQVKAAAIVKNPQLLRQEAASTAGVQFWNELENNYRDHNPLDRLLAKTPAAIAAVGQMTAAEKQAQADAGKVGYAEAPANAFGLKTALDEQQAKAKAIEMLKQTSAFKPKTVNIGGFSGVGSQTIAASDPTALVNSTPAIQLPKLVQTYTGSNPGWYVNSTYAREDAHGKFGSGISGQAPSALYLYDPLVPLGVPDAGAAPTPTPQVDTPAINTPKIATPRLDTTRLR